MSQAIVQQNPIDALAENHDDDGVVLQGPGVFAAIAKSETEAQLDAAHKYPRSVARFLREATSLAIVTREVAESCIYNLPRGGKTIDGPSVRLAEICASSYGNLHVGGRIADIEDRDVVAQGVAWDLEKNLRVSVEVRRRIVDKWGKRFNDDMLTLTGNAAASIALRNAIFRVVPRAFVDRIYEEARKVAVGDSKTLEVRRDEWLQRLQKMGITQDRVLARLGKAGVQDIGLDDLAILIGLANTIRAGEVRIDDAFPAPSPAPAAAAQDGQRVKVAAAKQEQKPAEQPTEQPAQPTTTSAHKSESTAGGPPPPPPDRPARRQRQLGDDDE